jgi:3-(3-hydroxy-phenyl)propionate hydroxylase
VLGGTAPVRLLDTYCSERRAASRENILNSTRATDFITPKFAASRIFRDATLALARDFPFARALINSGRLSVPTAHTGSPLDTPDCDGDWTGGPSPGRAMLDAPLGKGWLIDRLGRDFTVLTFDGSGTVPAGTALVSVEGERLARQRYDARPGTTYLIRPDRYVAARWRRFDLGAIAKAQERAMGKEDACFSGA